jgi:DNA-binding PadR family transcriptional regulator
MKWLSRKEEFLLLTILRLKGEAYGLAIREQVTEKTNQYWSIGATYDVLDRLERKNLVKSSPGAPTPERGGRTRRYYRVTRAGYRALNQVRTIQSEMWFGLPESIIERG